MITSLSAEDLNRYINAQLEHFMPDGHCFDVGGARTAFNLALDRLENAFSAITYKGYQKNGVPTFSHLHADQMTQFLYFYGNSLWQTTKDDIACSKLMNLNRMLYNVFISYKCNLPEHFLLIHAFGTILGNAKYGDYLVCMQNVTVNTGSVAFEKPIIGKGCFLASYSKIIGDQNIGERCSIGVGCTVYNTQIPDDSVVIDNGRELVVMRNKRQFCKAQEYFNVPLM